MSRKVQHGIVALEFAFVLPLLLTLLFAVFQFSWLICNYLMLADAASIGAHVLASERGYAKPYSDTRDAVLSALKPLRGAPTIVASIGGITCDSDTTCQAALGSMTSTPAPGAAAHVTLTYAFSAISNANLWNLTALMPSQLNADMAEFIQ